jgi:hypothetical protein
MTVYAYAEQLFLFLYTRDHQILVMAVYVGCFLFTIVLRIVTCTHYRSLLLRFRTNAKEMRTVDDIKNIRFSMLKKLVAEYMQLAAKNAARVPTAALAEKQLVGFRFMGWRYESIMPFVEILESGLLWVGLIIALLFEEYVIVYGLLAVVGFLLTRLAAAFFDFRFARNTLANELVIYIEREISAMFPINISGTILPRIEMTDAAQMVKDMLAEPMHHWAASISEAALAQKQLNEAAIKIREATASLAAPLTTHGEVLAALATDQNNLQKHTALVEQNQRALETAYDSYEASLKTLVETLGDGLGAYLKLHGQTAAQAVNDALTGNFDKIVHLMQNRENP